VDRDLSIIERAILELLKPFGFYLSSVTTEYIIIIKGKEVAVCMEQDMVNLYWWDNVKDQWGDKLVVCLCDPGSLEAIEKWAIDGWVRG